MIDAEEVQLFCCYGYIVDLLIALGNRTNITYDLHLVGDDQYGIYEKVGTMSSTLIAIVEI